MRPCQQRGQSAVEIVAVAPVVVVVALVLLQGVTATWTAAEAAGALRAAARAESVGTDPVRAARAELPAPLRRGLIVRRREGRLTVVVRTPALVPGGVPGLRRIVAEVGP